MDRRRASKLMRTFWDRKAQENVMYYISSYRPYDEQDPEEFWKWGRILAEQFLEESEIQFTGDESILEIGCGIGRMTACFAERFKQVHGIDVSPEMISQARDNLNEFDNVHLYVGNGYDLSGFGDASFDFVFSYLTFQHIPDPLITLHYIQEAGRVLRKGGHLYFQVNNMTLGLRERFNLRSKRRWLLRRLRITREHGADAAAGPKDLDNPAWQGSRVSITQIKRACELGKLKVSALKGQRTQYLWVKAIKLQ